MGMGIATIVRILLFLAVLGVVSKGFALDPGNPPASAFQEAAGTIGYKLFGLVIFAAALSSIVGAAYTSVSFLKTFTPAIGNHVNKWIIGFIAVSTIILITIGRPATLLVIAGSLNGLILPVTLGIMLVASTKKEIIGDYKHPKWLFILGVLVVLITAYLGVQSLSGLAALWG
jgi:Mn2+/Fe2+ NRAMP family transporter